MASEEGGVSSLAARSFEPLDTSRENLMRTAPCSDRPLALLACFLFLLLSACGAAMPIESREAAMAPPSYGGDESMSAPMASQPMQAPAMAAPMQPGFAAQPAPSPAGAPMAAPASAKGAPTEGATEGPSAASTSPARMIIYTAALQMQTAKGEVPKAIDAIIDRAEALGGFLVNRTDTTVEVRIPSGKFRAGLASFEEVAEALHRSVSATDVSEEFHDLEVRLDNLRATRKRLQEFLAKSATIPEMLTVEKELARVVGEIDQIQGRLRFLAQRAAFSTVRVEISEKPEVAKQIASPTPTPPPPPPRAVSLPIDWLPNVGLYHLLDLD
mgnify:CR=1 FL=1